MKLVQVAARDDEICLLDQFSGELLGSADQSHSYGEAWAEWDACGEAASWDAVIADGV